MGSPSGNGRGEQEVNPGLEKGKKKFAGLRGDCLLAFSVLLLLRPLR